MHKLALLLLALAMLGFVAVTYVIYDKKFADIALGLFAGVVVGSCFIAVHVFHKEKIK